MKENELPITRNAFLEEDTRKLKFQNFRNAM